MKFSTLMKYNQIFLMKNDSLYLPVLAIEFSYRLIQQIHLLKCVKVSGKETQESNYITPRDSEKSGRKILKITVMRRKKTEIR